jgi:hypothetical protein
MPDAIVASTDARLIQALRASGSPERADLLQIKQDIEQAGK